MAALINEMSVSLVHIKPMNQKNLMQRTLRRLQCDALPC
jgi:hypothetical protein